MTVSRRTSGTSLAEWAAALPLLFTSDATVTGDVSRALASGLLRKVGPRVYTTDRSRPLEEIVRSNAILVASLRFPGAVISHRSALEMQSAEGLLFVTGSYEKVDRLPGLTIRQVRGPGPLDGDMPVMGLLRASDARAFLENLRRTRRSGGVSRVLPRRELERRLERRLSLGGEAALNRLRDHARALAPALKAQEAFALLDEIIGGLLRTREARLTAPTAVARRQGAPFDEARLDLFERLAAQLRERWGGTSRPLPHLLREERQNCAFIDAYFSNYIEGTIFEVSEAIDIVFDRRIPERRPADAHDILGTFELLADATEMGVSAAVFELPEDFEAVLKRRHYRIMAGRPEGRPGEFKDAPNRAGNTPFVTPDRVRGTLQRGFQVFRTLETPFQRAAFMMFLVSEIHPFTDGNGRLARAMMNAELVASGQSRIIIVTAYRTDYLGVLRRLSGQRDPIAYLRMLDRAHEFTSRLDFTSLEALRETLERCNAFDDTGLRIMRLPPPR